MPKIIKYLFHTTLEALFPISRAEREVLSMNGELAVKLLPRAPRAPIHEACSLFAYKDERVWRLIWAMKYRKSRVAARIAAYALWQILKVYVKVLPRLIIVPMPITKKRRRERGYNQCELLADELESLMEERSPVPFCHELSDINSQILIVRDLLLRTHHVSRQTLKDRRERLESTKGVFVVDETAVAQLKSRLSLAPALTPETHDRTNCMIIVIDDVITTGSTVREAVETLRRVGFASTYGLSVAH